MSRSQMTPPQSGDIRRRRRRIVFIGYCRGTQGRRRRRRRVYSYSSDTVEGPRAPAVKLTARFLSPPRGLTAGGYVRLPCPGLRT